jgi:hypothetical protein
VTSGANAGTDGRVVITYDPATDACGAGGGKKRHHDDDPDKTTTGAAPAAPVVAEARFTG